MSPAVCGGSDATFVLSYPGLQGAYDRARHILTENLSELHALAGELLEKETLNGDQIRVIMKQVKDGIWAPPTSVIDSVKKGAASVVQQATKGAAAAAGAAKGSSSRPSITP
eukprot:GHUV01030767.1.p2 GENE.GHUV01030767.1~~GHUV01030767.1.p2  ORF type:complete len:112 (+),score=38.48 GHUV01030767.1:339-674(+)